MQFCREKWNYGILRPLVDKQSKSPEENTNTNMAPKIPCAESDTEDEEPKAALGGSATGQQQIHQGPAPLEPDWREAPPVLFRQAKKRKYVIESSESEDAKKRKYVIESSESEDDFEEKKHENDKAKAAPSCDPWRQTVKDLNVRGYIQDKAIMGKVIVKSVLPPYETQKKEKKFWSSVGFADDTGATKLTVYGKQHFDRLQEGHFYSLRNLLVDEDAKRVTVITVISKLSRNTLPTISADMEMEAKQLVNIEWPVFSIAEANNWQEKTEMTIEGTIMEMNNVEVKNVKGGRTRKKTTKMRKMTLQDASGSIQVVFWGDQVGLCSSLRVGDTIRVANVRSTEFLGTMSLNATGITWVYKVKDASFQTVQINIIGIINASKKDTTLEAELNLQIQKLLVDSKLLAKACGIRLEGDFEDKLLDEMPFLAEVKMQGNRIAAITQL